MTLEALRAAERAHGLVAWLAVFSLFVAAAVLSLPRPDGGRGRAAFATVAAAAAVFVLTKAATADVPADKALPALKPNQPTHRSEAPLTLSTRLCGAMFSVPRPLRLPSTRHVTRPAVPALRCTTVPPA